MNKSIYILILIILLNFTVYSQISHGGKPLPFNKSSMRSSSNIEYIDMPKFDNISKLRSTQISTTSKFRSLDFAHKFHVNLRPDNSGEIFETNGYRVWRVAIRSKEAHSLNIFFSTFHIPEGGKLFIYNPSQTEILGSYTHKNNSDIHKLPIQPIPSDRVIVEYQEPINADFRGRLEIGEVNHDYLGIFRATGEPRDAETLCHSDLICFPEDEQAGQGTVALIINGTTYCSGSLLNNTEENGTPYLLTATHCLNSEYAYTYPSPIYQNRAETMVVFFNYNSPVCGKKDNRIIDHFRGITQMSMASADSVLISEKHDISLLKLKETPPEEYKATLLGWNAEDHPKGEYHGIHHPNGGVKKVSRVKKPIYKVTTKPNFFTPSTFWAAPPWDEGITEGGSSGSPLLDKNKRVLGSLTDGNSFCDDHLAKGPDNYASLHSFWDVAPSLGNPNSISKYLDPTDSGRKEMDSKDMFDHDSALYILNNFYLTDIFEPSNIETSTLFQTNGVLGSTEFAEEFNSGTPISLHGIYISTPPIGSKQLSNMDVKLRIYTGSKFPKKMIKEIDFKYNYKIYKGASFKDRNREMNHTVENYIKLDEPLRIKGRFFISFTEENGVNPGFSVLNVKGRDKSSIFKSTAWIKEGESWTNASNNKIKPCNTSLYISAHVKKDFSNVQDEDEDQDERCYSVYYTKDSKKINIKSEYPIRRVSIYSITGQLIDDKHLKSNRTELSIPFFMGKGLYAVRTVTDNKTHTDKILIE